MVKFIQANVKSLADFVKENPDGWKFSIGIKPCFFDTARNGKKQLRLVFDFVKTNESETVNEFLYTAVNLIGKSMGGFGHITMESLVKKARMADKAAFESSGYAPDNGMSDGWVFGSVYEFLRIDTDAKTIEVSAKDRD